MHLNYMYILECSIGLYGENCDNKCSEYCSELRRCDRFTGQCYGGCQPGWFTKTCEQSMSPFVISICTDERGLFELMISFTIYVDSEF